jgi:acyl-CoA thioesterase YciA
MERLTTKIAMAQDLGVHGNLFGGNMLSWIDEAGASLAYKVCQSANMVTVKLEEVVFKKAVKEGMLIHIYGKVEHIGNTSIRMLMEARKFNVSTGAEEPVTTTNITFVHIDAHGHPIPIKEEVKRNYAKS